MNWNDIDISEINDIKTLQEIACLGETAQERLNAIAESIFDTYQLEVQRVTAELEKEFPGKHIESISPFVRRYYRFDSFHIQNNCFCLKGVESFRGETDYEWDDLPITVWIEDRENRNKIIVEVVKAKIDAIREELKGRELRREAAARLQYEQLKERFEK